MKIRLKPLLGGITTILFPQVAGRMGRRNYPRLDAEYYYRVWLSHVCIANHFKVWDFPETVLEIGPGTSLGVGVAALLSGVSKYLAFDSNRLLTGEASERLIHELANLYAKNTPLAEFDSQLAIAELPQQLFSTERMAYFLSPEWLDHIKFSLTHQNDLIYYFNDPDELEANSVDYIFSQSVLEHVEDLAVMYQLMWKWLKPGGVMTHSIDFSAHGTSKLWNGHWAVADWLWQLMEGKRLYFVNRIPISEHQALLQRYGFELTGIHPIKRNSALHREELTARFQNLSETDLTTTSAFLTARKPLL